jgi:hypothetical protein
MTRAKSRRTQQTAAAAVVYRQPNTGKSKRPTLSKCAAKFALANVDPFNPASFGACNPGWSCSESEKISAFGGFDIVIGTQGIGWALLFQPNSNNNLLAFVTGATYSGNMAIPLSTNNTLNTGVSAVYPTNLKYSTSDLQAATADQAQAQLVPVSLGFEAQYIGTTLNMSGMIYCFADPDHTSTCGMSQSDLLARGETAQEGVTRKKCRIVLTPTDLNECVPAAVGNVLTNYYPYSNSMNMSTSYGGTTSYTYMDAGSITAGCPVGIIMVTGVAGQLVHVQWRGEWNGRGVKPSSSYTPHHVDTSGATEVMGAMQMVPASRKSYPGKSDWSIFTSILGAVQDGASEIILPMAEMALASFL